MNWLGSKRSRRSVSKRRKELQQRQELDARRQAEKDRVQAETQGKIEHERANHHLHMEKLCRGRRKSQNRFGGNENSSPGRWGGFVKPHQ